MIFGQAAVRDPYAMSMMVRRPAFDRVGPFAAARRLGEDIEWLFRARSVGVHIAVVEEPLVRRRVHGGNLTIDVTPAQMQRQVLGIVHDRIRAAREEGGP
jgi:hypothetical protein